MAKRSVNWHQELVKKTLADANSFSEYEAFKLQLELAEKFKKARQRANLTQENIAEKMATHKPSIARLEAAGGKGKHSPSLLTLVKYAHALGYRLKVNLVRESDQYA